MSLKRYNLWNLFDVVNLVHNHRQKEERQWTEILNKIWVNTIIENKEEKTFELEYPEIEDALKPRLLKPFKDKPKKVSKLKRKRKGDSKLEVNQVTNFNLTVFETFQINIRISQCELVSIRKRDLNPSFLLGQCHIKDIHGW